jgi:hypothetical protein
MDTHATIEVPLETAFYTWSMLRRAIKAIGKNIRGLNLAVVKLMTIKVTKLPL